MAAAPPGRVRPAHLPPGGPWDPALPPAIGPEYADPVPSWSMIEQAAPEFAARARELLDAGRHKTIATLRADGAPRISGIECEFVDGDLRFGSMTGARKGADLARDLSLIHISIPPSPVNPGTVTPLVSGDDRAGTGPGRLRRLRVPQPRCSYGFRKGDLNVWEWSEQLLFDAAREAANRSARARSHSSGPIAPVLTG